jgi:outer membrane protein assembly factor BamB
MRWGSAASLILYKDLVIVNASEESRSIRALDKATGEEKWKAQADGLEQCYATPVLVNLKDGSAEIVIAVPGEVWGLNPDTGKLKWFAETALQGTLTPTVVVDEAEGIVYAFGGNRGSGSVAIRTGGKGDVTDSHVVWTSRISSYVPSPVLHEGRIYCVDDRGVAVCMNAKDGSEVFRERLAGGGDGGFGGGRGASRPFYSSVLLAGDKLIAVGRTGTAYVFAAGPEFKLLAKNQFSGDAGDYNASPAAVDGCLYLRSDKYLYCISEK